MARCQFCGEECSVTISANNGPQIPWCVKPKCQKARKAAIVAHARMVGKGLNRERKEGE